MRPFWCPGPPLSQGSNRSKRRVIGPRSGKGRSCVCVDPLTVARSHVLPVPGQDFLNPNGQSMARAPPLSVC